MGWEQIDMRITAFVSRHNSDRDRADDALCRHLADRMREIADDPKYMSLGLITSGLDWLDDKADDAHLGCADCYDIAHDELTDHDRCTEHE